MRTRTCPFLIALTVGTLCAGRSSGDTLELRIVADDEGSQVEVHSVPASVGLRIQGRLATPSATDGLALWHSDVRNLGSLDVNLADPSAFLMEAPAALAEYFGGSNGFANPIIPVTGAGGFRGSNSGRHDLLWQVGGGQNTMSHPAGGGVLFDVANLGSWTDLAVGSIQVDGDFGDTIVLALEDASATTFDSGATGPVHAVSHADVNTNGVPLTIAITSPLVTAYSSAIHAASTNGWETAGTVGLPIVINSEIGTVGVREPRAFATTNGLIWIDLAFADAVDPLGISYSVEPDPGPNVNIMLLQGDAPNEVEFHWGGSPVIDVTTNGYAYWITFSGQGSGRVGIAFVPGDIDGDGITKKADGLVITNPLNLGGALCELTTVRADLNRDGYCSPLDNPIVAAHLSKPTVVTPAVLSTDPPALGCP